MEAEIQLLSFIHSNLQWKGGYQHHNFTKSAIKTKLVINFV
jgi:hypothetical protein